jgi:U3 small nucleolar RNA-associated protein 5
MASPNNRDLLTSFSPDSDFFAISSGDGRIKVRFPLDFCGFRCFLDCSDLMGFMGFHYSFCLFFLQIWDTLKGNLQTEFSNISVSDDSRLLCENKKGHLSLDYTCMKWVQLESKVLSLLIMQINCMFLMYGRI